MHKPGDEKRSLVIVAPDDYDAWLGGRDAELARTYFVHGYFESLTGIPMAALRGGLVGHWLVDLLADSVDVVIHEGCTLR